MTTPTERERSLLIVIRLHWVYKYSRTYQFQSYEDVFLALNRLQEQNVLTGYQASRKFQMIAGVSVTLTNLHLKVQVLSAPIQRVLHPLPQRLRTERATQFVPSARAGPQPSVRSDAP